MSHRGRTWLAGEPILERLRCLERVQKVVTDSQNSGAVNSTSVDAVSTSTAKQAMTAINGQASVPIPEHSVPSTSVEHQLNDIEKAFFTYFAHIKSSSVPVLAGAFKRWEAVDFPIMNSSDTVECFAKLFLYLLSQPEGLRRLMSLHLIIACNRADVILDDVRNKAEEFLARKTTGAKERGRLSFAPGDLQQPLNLRAMFSKGGA